MAAEPAPATMTSYTLLRHHKVAGYCRHLMRKGPPDTVSQQTSTTAKRKSSVEIQLSVELSPTRINQTPHSDHRNFILPYVMSHRGRGPPHGHRLQTFRSLYRATVGFLIRHPAAQIGGG